MLVARLPSLERGAAVGPIAVTDSRAGAEIGCDTGWWRTGGRCSMAARVGLEAVGALGWPVGRRSGTAAAGLTDTPAADPTDLLRTDGCRCSGCDALDGGTGGRDVGDGVGAQLPGRAADRHRRRRRRRPRRPWWRPTSKISCGPSGLPMLMLLAVLDIDGGHPASVDEHPVEAAVVDGDPPALIEPQHQMRAGDQGMGDADIGAEVAADDDVVAGREVAGRSVVPNGQRGRCWSAHRDQLYR